MTSYPVYRPILQKDESPASVLMRASFFNGYSSPMQFINWCKGNKRLPSSIRHLTRNGGHFLKVCKLLGIQLPTSTSSVIPKKYGMKRQDFYGVNIRVESLRNNFAYCPICLSENKYHKRFWDHSYIQVCTHHKVKIIEVCEACNSPIEWNRRSPFECTCGHNLLKTVTPSSNSIVEEYLQQVFLNADQNAYDDFDEMFQSLSQFFGESRTPRESQELTVIGMESPETLSDILTSELLSNSQTLKYHPILTMVDFEMASGAQIKQLVKLTKESFHRAAQTDSYVDYSGELLEYGRVSKVLGISTSQAAELRRNNILKGYQVKPGVPFKIEQRSIHNLVTRLGMLPSYTLKQSVTVNDCLNNPDIKLTLSEILKGVLNENIKLVSFSWSAPLLTMRIEKQFPKYSKQELFQLVPLKDYVEYTGLHTNDVREAIKEHSEIDYFNSGYTDGANKYLTIEVANQLTEILKHRYSRPSKIERVRAAVQSNALPVTSVAVYFK